MIVIFIQTRPALIYIYMGSLNSTIGATFGKPPSEGSVPLQIVSIFIVQKEREGEQRHQPTRVFCGKIIDNLIETACCGDRGILCVVVGQTSSIYTRASLYIYAT